MEEDFKSTVSSRHGRTSQHVARGTLYLSTVMKMQCCLQELRRYVLPKGSLVEFNFARHGEVWEWLVLIVSLDDVGGRDGHANYL